MFILSHSCSITISDPVDRDHVTNLLPRQAFLFTIEEFGKGLHDINLLINCFNDDLNHADFEAGTLDFIINGCPNLKTLSLGSQNSLLHSNLIITEKSLEDLSKECKGLKDLKITKAQIVWHSGGRVDSWVDTFDRNCNVEIKECEFDEKDDSSWMEHDYDYESYDYDYHYDW